MDLSRTEMQKARENCSEIVAVQGGFSLMSSTGHPCLFEGKPIYLQFYCLEKATNCTFTFQNLGYIKLLILEAEGLYQEFRDYSTALFPSKPW